MSSTSSEQQKHDLRAQAALKDLDRFVWAYPERFRGDGAWTVARRIMDRMIDTLSEERDTPGEAVMIILEWLMDHDVFQAEMKRILDLEKAS